MQEVKRIFNERYKGRDINELQEYERGKYKPGSIERPIVYSTDCIFDKSPGKSGKRCDEFIFFNLNRKGIKISLRGTQKRINHIKTKGTLPKLVSTQRKLNEFV